MAKNVISINATEDRVATTVTIGTKEFALIPINMLNVNNRWQRSLETGKACRKIGMLCKVWDEGQCRPITVIYNEATRLYDVVDGGHRTRAAEILGIPSLVAEIIRPEGTETERERIAAKLFAEQGYAVDKLTPAEKHKANVMLGVRENLNLEAAANRVGFSLKLTGERGTSRRYRDTNYVCGFKEALTLAKLNPDVLNRTFDIIKETKWCEELKGLSAAAIRMIGRTLMYHLDQVDEVESTIKQVILGKTPKQIFAEAMAMYPGRTDTARNILYLEGEICKALNIERRFIPNGGKVA